MGLKELFGVKNKIIDLSDLEKLYYKYTKNLKKDFSFILYEIEQFEYGESDFFLQDEDEFRKFFTAVITNLEDYDKLDNIHDLFDDAKEIYNYVCPLKKDTENYEELFNVFIQIFSGKIYKSNLFNKEIFSSFENKKNYLEIMDLIASSKDASLNFESIIDFITTVSSLSANETILKSSVISFIRALPTSSNIEDLSKRRISDLEKYAGIYHIDRYLLAELDAKINSASSIFTRLDKLTLSIDEELKLMKIETEQATIQFDRVKKDKLFEAASSLESLKTSLRLLHADLLNEARKALSSQKDDLLREFEIKLAPYNKVIDDIERSNEEQIRRVLEKFIKDNDSSLRNLSSLMNSDEVKALIESLKSNPSLLVPTEKNSISSTIKVVETPTIVIPEKTGLIKAFDTSIPYQERFRMIMEEKERDIEENSAVYHEKTDDIIAMLLSGTTTPYLYGPSQCGKTYNVNQICNLLHLPIREVGKINEEYNILGFKTATGLYSRTNFRDSYECGYAAFVDEIDTGDPNATGILSEFLGKPDGSKYSFPDSVVYKHPNFRVIAAGNTDGSGANFAYSTRHKLDEAILQRLTPIYYGYDEVIEKKATEGFEEWLEFTYQFRNALENINVNSIGGSGRNANVILGNVTTKDLYVIREWLLNLQFGSKEDTIRKIIEYQFIGSKSEKTLSELVQSMEEFYSVNRNSSKLYKIFSDRTNIIRRQGR